MTMALMLMTEERISQAHESMLHLAPCEYGFAGRGFSSTIDVILSGKEG